MLEEADPFLLHIHEQANKIVEENPVLKKLLMDLDSLLLRSEKNIPFMFRKTYCLSYLLLDAIKLGFDRLTQVQVEAPIILYEVLFNVVDLLRVQAVDLVQGEIKELNLVLGLTLVQARDLALTISQTQFLDQAQTEVQTKLEAQAQAQAQVQALTQTLDSVLDLDQAEAKAKVQTLAQTLDLNFFKTINNFLMIKKRLIECLRTECYLSPENRQRLKEQMLEVSNIKNNKSR